MYLRAFKILTLLLFAGVNLLYGQSPPQLIAPEDSATDISTTVTLQWHSVDDANSYNLQLATDSSFNNRVVDTSGLSDTTYTVEQLSNDSTYYWRVSSSSLLTTSDWSDSWQFTTLPQAPAKTNLYMPENDTDSLSTDITFKWHTATRAESYRLQISRDSQFETLDYDRNSLTDTTHAVSGLSTDTTYYWRVRGSNESGAGPWSDIWHFTTASSDSGQVPDVPQLTSPSDGADNQSTEVTLKWDTVSNADHYGLQLSKNSSFETLIVNSSSLTNNSFTIDSLDHNTHYYWRVNASNEHGASSWSNSRQFTTTEQPPDSVTLRKPDNNAENLSTELQVAWDSTARADSYQLQITRDAGFETVNYNFDGLTDTSESVSGLEADTSYYWRVRAKNDGGVGPWSNAWQFSTSPADSGDTSAPKPPDLVSPADGADSLSRNVTVEWDTVSNADQYGLQVATDSSFDSRVIDTLSLQNNEFTASDLNYGQVYFWKVHASNSNDTSDWSGHRNFRTKNNPDNSNGPTLSSPPDGADNQPTTLTLSWESYSSASSYHLQIARNADFSDIVRENSSISSTSYEISNLSNDTRYYWRVRANELLGTSDWSNTWEFTTVPQAPEVPALVQPENNTEDLPKNITFKWEITDRAERYQLQIATNDQFDSLKVDLSDLQSTSREINELESNRRFYWRVRAANDGGTSSWSQIWNFKTEHGDSTGGSLPAPSLVSPTDGAENLDTNVDLDWNTVDDANTYEIQLATDSLFNNKIVQLDGVTSTIYPAEDLDYNTTYYWKTRAKNDTSSGSWSAVWSFKTEMGPFLRIERPKNGRVLKIGETINIQWTSNKVDSIHLSYSTDGGNNWNVFAQNIPTSENSYSWEVPELSGNYCKIRMEAVNHDNLQATSDPLLLYRTSFQYEFSYSFNSTAESKNYRLVGLPGSVNLPVQQILEGEPDKDWKVYHDDGSAEDYMIEYDSTDTFNFKPGNGFWVISKQPVAVSSQVESVSLDSNEVYKVEVNQGWNIISNPFEVPILWSAVQEENNMDRPLWSFEGSYKQSSTMDPGFGYYYFHDSNTSHVNIPYAPDTVNNKKPSRKNSADSLIHLSLHSESTQHAAISFGISAGNKQKVEYAPPAQFKNINFTMVNKNKKGRREQLYTQVLPKNADGNYTWDVRIKADTDHSLQLQAINTGIIDKQIYWVNPSTGAFKSLKGDQTIKIDQPAQYEDYRILVGHDSYIKQKKDEILPEEVQLRQNYPNPFNGQTVIEYFIPSGQDKKMVTLAIYNVLGKKIRTLVNTPQRPGRYRIKWDGRNEGSHTVSSGVYLFRLKTDNKTKVKKMTFMK